MLRLKPASAGWVKTLAIQRKARNDFLKCLRLSNQTSTSALELKMPVDGQLWMNVIKIVKGETHDQTMTITQLHLCSFCILFSGLLTENTSHTVA